MESHWEVGSVERKRWISFSEASYFPSAFLLLLVSLLPAQTERMEKLMGGRSAGVET